MEKCSSFIKPDVDAESGFTHTLVPEWARWMASDDWVKLDDIEVTYEVPGNLSQTDLRRLAVKTLKEKQERIIAEAVVNKGKLQVRIDELLLIEDRSNDDGWLDGRS